MRPHPRYAATDPTHPEGWGTCDRCGFVWNLRKFQWQYDWRGIQLQNLNTLICPNCVDKPQRQLGSVILTPDPIPLLNARPEQYSIDESNPPQTQLTANVAYKGTSLQVQSTTGFATGNFAAVELNNGAFTVGTVTVTSATTMTISNPLAYAAASTNQVTWVPTTG